MTNEEAINYGEDYLKDSICAVCGVEDKHKEFVKMSISALEKQIKLNKLGFTEEVIENYKIFEDECIEKGFTFRSLLDARERQINGGWIPCSERLPKIYDDTRTSEIVLVQGYDKEIDCDWQAMGWYAEEPKQWYFAECKNTDKPINWIDIIAWQPLPQPYLESEVNK